MQHTPRIDQVEFSQAFQITRIEHRAFFHRPIRIVAEKPPLQLARAGHGIRVVIERMDPSAQPAGRETEQATARADVEKRRARQIVDTQHGSQRTFGFLDSLDGEQPQESLPILAELISLSAGDLLGMIGHNDNRLFAARDREPCSAWLYPLGRTDLASYP